MKVTRIDPQTWKILSRDAHLAVFKERLTPEQERIDFALIVAEGPNPWGYVTCREFDSDTLYWSHGGSFPPAKDTFKTFKGYQGFVDWCRGRYLRITTYIENTNTVMLKMAMKVGFRIIGVRLYKDKVLVEHGLEFEATHPQQKGG